MIYHIPVLLKEVIELLNLKPGHNVIDCTLGGGGHSQEILKHTAPDGKLLGIDADPAAIRQFKAQSAKFKIKEKIKLVQDNFVNLESIVKEKNFKPINAVLLDLGMSSYQLDQAGRGFSFQKDTALNMRLEGGEGGKTAYEIINQYPKQKLKQIFQTYGEIKNSGAIARKIDSARQNHPIATTSMLVHAVFPAFSKRGRGIAKFSKTETKLLARLWQAIRIEVNQELRNLTKVLPQITKILEKQGRIAVISYHSLEDRIVKKYFRAESKRCICPSDFPVCCCKHQPQLKIITKKIVRPGEQEIKENPRARSAKLRVAEKV
jgi:16S rRNA (cytosine1402-N4)-methyltransferase